MAEHYDYDYDEGKDENPKRPRQGKPDDSGQFSWPLIIVLFALGLTPVALVLLFLNLFGKKGKQKNVSTQRHTAVQEVMEERRSHTNKRTEKKEAKAAPVNGGSEKTAKNKKKKQKIPGKFLRVFGIILLAIGGIVTADSLSGVFYEYWLVIEDLLAGLSFMGIGGAMWGRGNYLAQMTLRSQRYIMAIGNADVMPIQEIAKRVNRTSAQAAKELQKLIDKGYLGEDSYIDHEKGYFLRFGATLEEPVEEEQPPSATEVPEEAEEGYASILRNIRRANDRIADEELSRKIERLEQISSSIFKEVEEHPEKRERIRTFFEYYLPTTQKLLDAYAEFEETGVEGAHMRDAKERIEQTMDAIVEGFEHQLDQLYSGDAMDVVSDIKVMEAMLGRDTASAAKDFGYDPFPKKKANAEDDGGLQQLEL